MPEQVGLVEVFVDKPNIRREVLTKVSEDVVSYFPQSLLVITLLDPISLKVTGGKHPKQEEAVSTLLNVKLRNDMQKIVGISREVLFIKKRPWIVGRAFPDKDVAIYNFKKRCRISPLGIGHELGHLYLVEEFGKAECPIDYLNSKFKSTELQDYGILGLMLGLIEEPGFENIEKGLRSICRECPEKGYIMCPRDTLKHYKKSFSPRHYAYLESLVK